MEPIRSPRNPLVVAAGRLRRARERRRRRLTLVEGPNPVQEAIAAGVQPERLFVLIDDPRLDQWPDPTLVSPEVMDRLAGTETPRGPVAVIRIPDPPPIPTDRHLLVLCGLGDPGNVGTLIRSAVAFGLALAWTPGTADPWSPKVLRAGAGAHFRGLLVPLDDPRTLASHRLAAAVPRSGIDPSRLEDGPWAVLLGSEAHGLPPDLAGAVDASVSIPTPGPVESLNVAAAGSILAYLLGRAGSPATPTNLPSP